MDFEMVTLRLLHIVFGVLWAGTSISFALILHPRLHRLGPAIMGPAMAVLAPAMTWTMLPSAVITIVAGSALALRLRWGHLDTFLSTGWGWAMLLGFLTSIGALSAGVMSTVLSNRMNALGASIAGRPPTPGEGAELERLSVQLPRVGRATAVTALIAIGTMATARFV